MSRRKVLNRNTRIRRNAFLVACVLTIASCTGDTATTTSAEPVTTTTGAPGSPEPENGWDVLEMMLASLRQSPDHRRAAYDRVIAAGDPEAALAWVRSSFRAMPTNLDGYANPLTAGRWGPDGVLRTGAGTPRDIADLLAQIYEEMGLAAHVVAQRFDEVRDVTTVAEPAFAPDPSAEELAESLGLTLESTPTEPIDPDLVRSTAANVLQGFPDNLRQERHVIDLKGTLPAVVVEIDGAPHLADLWGLDGSISPTEGSVPSSAGPTQIPEVSFRLLTLASNETEPIEVARLDTTLDQLVGHQVEAGFAPVVESTLDLASIPPRSVTTFLPILRVDGDQELVATGQPITTRGDRLTETDDGYETQVGGIVGGGSAETVSQVAITDVDSSAFPEVDLTVRVAGDSGLVDGVAASEFSLTEDGAPVPTHLRSNTGVARRVLFLLDTSLSVPEEFRGGGAVEVIRSVATTLSTNTENVEFRVANVTGDGAASRSQWSPDSEVAVADAERLGPSAGSPLWAAYAEADSAFDPDVIVFLTDGTATDDALNLVDGPTPEESEQIDRAAPAIMIGTGDLGPAFEEIAQLSGGEAFEVADQEAAIAAIVDRVESLTVASNYQFTIVAPEDGPDTRTLHLSVNGLDTEATYVPVANPSSETPRLAGLYLEIESMGTTVRRTLAGIRPASNGRYEASEVDDGGLEDVHLALFGSYSVSIDGGAPSLSEQLEQVVEAALTLRPVTEAETEEELDAALAGLITLSDHALAFSAPLVDGEFVFEQAFRAWLDIERRTFTEDGELLLRQVDILPFTFFDAVTAEDAFDRTATATATLAVLEDRLLGGEETEVSPPLVYDELPFEILTPLKHYWGNLTIASASPTETSEFWAIDRRSGSLIPVLADGSGGTLTVEEVNQTFDRISTLLDTAGMVDGMPTSITLWAKLEQAKLAKLRTATIAILTMGGDLEVGPTDFNDEACDAVNEAGNAAANAAGGAIFGAGAMGVVDEVRDAVGKFNDFGGFFGAEGIPTEFEFC